MSPQQVAAALKPLVSRVYTGHCAIIEGSEPPVASSRPLTMEKLIQHCSNQGVRYGVYPIAPGENVTKCAVLDLDSHKGEVSWKRMVEVAGEIEREATFEHGIAFNRFRSGGGKGIHLIALWEEPQDAYTVRCVLADILAACGLRNGTKGVAQGQVEIFPKQDSVPVDGWGNMFILPFAKKSAALDDATWEPTTPDKAPWHLSAPQGKRERPAPPPMIEYSADVAQLASMLEAIPNDELNYELYFRIMCAVHHATEGRDEGLQLFEVWASKNPANRPEENRRIWGPLGRRTDGPVITAGTLRNLAENAGWVDQSLVANFEILDKDGDVVVQDQDAGKSAVVVRRNNAGQIIPTRDSVSGFLRFNTDVTRMQIRYDDFLARMVRIDGEVGVKPIEDEDYTLIAIRLERHGFKEIPREVLREAVRLIGKYQQMDSAKDWLHSLPEWDGVERIAGFYAKYLGCADSAYARALGMYQWTGMAGRVVNPGCQLDITPIWVGPQGCGKTTSVKALVPSPDYFGPIDLAVRDADFSRKVRGKLIGEIGELRGMQGRDRESVKDLMTRTHEEWSEKFVEHSTRYARRIFMVATTNEGEFLDDPTGNRRYAPIHVGRCDKEAIERDRDQLWAEGLAKWRESGIAWQELARLQAEQHAQFEVTDEWDDRVASWLRETGKAAAGVRVSDVLEDVLYISPKDQHKQVQMRMAKILKRLGLSQTENRIDGVKAKRWIAASAAARRDLLPGDLATG